MKRLISILTGLVVATCALAGPNMLQFSAKAWETNAAATVTFAPDTDVRVNGYVQAVYVDATAGGTFTGTVSLVTEAAGSTGASRTILTDVDVIADEEFYPRGIADTTAGAAIANVPEKVPLVMDKLDLTLYGNGFTGVTATVYVFIDRDPAP